MANFTSILTGKQVESLLANYATCTTAGGTAAKVATISSINGAAPQFELFTGITVRVKFSNSNTVANPTLNVNNTGAKPIVRYGTTAPSTTAATSWSAGAIVSLTYDGTNWVMNDNNINYSVGRGLKLENTVISANLSYTTNGKNYKVQADENSGLYVNVPWTDTNTDTHNSHAIISGTKSDGSTQIKGSASSGDITLGDSGVTAGTYRSVTVNSKGIVVAGSSTDADTNTWRKVQLNGTDKLGTGTSTNPLNIKAGSNMTITESNGTFTFSATDTNTDTNTSHSHSAGVGLVGSGSAGTSGGTYDYKAKLRSETALTRDSAAATETANRIYPIAVDKSGYLAVNVPWENTWRGIQNNLTSDSTSDSLSAAQGKVLKGLIAGSTSNCVKLTGDQTIAGNKIFTGTTSTMTLHTYNPLYVNNGADNSKNTSLYTDTDGVFKIVNSSSSVKRPTYNGKGIALTDDLSSYLPLTGGTVSGNLSVSGKIMQGTTSSDATVASMNRYQSDLYVQGDGSAPNNPRVAGFYIGKSQSDDNRHMDIVSGGDYSYIDFNQAGHETDYDARLLVNVNTGNTVWQWDDGATDKTFNISGGTLRQNGVNVSLEGHTHTGYASSTHNHAYSGTTAASASAVAVVTGVGANGTATVLTGVKVSNSSSAAPGGHTHDYNKTTGVSLTANASTATGRITYVESISSTGVSASGTAKAGSETHTHSYTKPTGVSLGSNDTASGGVAYISSVSGSAPSLTGTKTFVTGVTQGSGSLTSNDTSSGGLRYVYAQGTFSAGTTPISSVSVNPALMDEAPTVIKGTLSGTTLTLTTVKVASAEHNHNVTISRGTAPSLGSPTYKYLHHTHTSASSAGTGTVGISGGSYSAATKYFHPSITTESANTGTPSATTSFVTGVSGGTTSATTKYLSAAPSNTSTTTSANSGTNFNAATAVSSNGTADVLTGVKATGTASVSSGTHTHEYSGTTGTPK